MKGPSGRAPRRIVVLGPPGSGKSTLARRLGDRHGLPVFHLDLIYWRPGWLPAEPAAFRAEIERMAGLPRWVMDGNYTDTIGPRLAAADTAIYLDMPSWHCVARVLKRALIGYGRERADGPKGCPERLDLEFLRFTAAWNRTRRARSLALIADFPGRGVILRGAGAARSAALT